MPSSSTPGPRAGAAALCAVLTGAITLHSSPAAAQDGTAVEAARTYYDALLAADTTAARRVSNGLLPIDFGRIDSVRLDEPVDLEECPELPELPARLRQGTDTGVHRRTLDSIAGVMDSLFRGLRDAERCAKVPTTLIVAGSPSQNRFTVEFPTSARMADDGWRVEAFGTGTRAAPAVLRTMGSLLRDLGDALEEATADSAGG